MYYNGVEVEQNSPKAFELYHKAAEQGFALAQYNLAVMYQNGEGIEQKFSGSFQVVS